MTATLAPTPRLLPRLAALALLPVLAACAVSPAASPEPEVLVGGIPFSQMVDGYGPLQDGEFNLPPVPPEYLEGVNRRVNVAYNGDLPAGTIEIDPHAKFLYWIQPGGQAIRYPIAVGRQGLEMSGTTVIRRKAEWPSWTPTANMLATQPEVYGGFAGGVPGGLANPLGARALYLYRGGRDTYFRIHGTNDMSSIGNSGSAGCIRMFNQDVIDLYNRVPTDTTVVVRTYADSVRLEGEAMANRGRELPPVIVDPATVYAAVERQNQRYGDITDGIVYDNAGMPTTPVGPSTIVSPFASR